MFSAGFVFCKFHSIQCNTTLCHWMWEIEDCKSFSMLYLVGKKLMVLGRLLISVLCNAEIRSPPKIYWITIRISKEISKIKRMTELRAYVQSLCTESLRYKKSCNSLKRLLKQPKTFTIYIYIYIFVISKLHFIYIIHDSKKKKIKLNIYIL